MDLLKSNLEWLEYKSNSWKFTDPGFLAYEKAKAKEERKRNSDGFDLRMPDNRGLGPKAAEENQKKNANKVFGIIGGIFGTILYIVALVLAIMFLYQKLTYSEDCNGYGLNKLMAVILMIVTFIFWGNPIGLLILGLLVVLDIFPSVKQECIEAAMQASMEIALHGSKKKRMKKMNRRTLPNEAWAIQVNMLQ